MTDSEITQLLEAHRNGDGNAFSQLLPLVYDDLKRIAHGQLARGPRGRTLNTTAVVHEAYLKLVRRDAAWNDRGHFYAVYIAEYGATTEVVRHDEDAVKRAQARIDELALKRQARLEELSFLEQAGQPFRIEPSHASAWPTNMFERLGSVGFATAATMGICLIFFTAGTRLPGSAGVRPRKLRSR